nr:S-adenosylmethionine synthase-like [Saimiri boliviensis boliviensis]
MNGRLNGFHEAFIEEGTFLFTSESVGEGGLCRRVLVQVSYAIGVSHPLSISIFHYNTSQKSERELVDCEEEFRSPP